jgi:hypothetical protein
MPDEPNPIYNGRTCAYCDAEDVQAQCRTCNDGLCRHAKLRHRTWDFRVTNSTGFVGVAFSNDINFAAVHGCCDLLTSTQCQLPYPNSEAGNACPTRVIRSSFYKWRRYTQTYSSVREYWRVCTNGLGQCIRIGPVDTCSQTIQYAKACVLGWVLVTEINQVRLFVTRTKPRYNCTPDRCQFRLALVVDGKIGLSWATQVTEGTNTTTNSSQLVCGEMPQIQCNSGPSANWPVGSPPTFDVAAVPVTLHPWRQVWRRTVDYLDFPMVFNASNSVSTTCGPKCAAAISGTFPTFGDPPTFVCDAPPTPSDCVNCFGASVSEDLCTAGTCETCPSASYPFRSDFGGARQSLISSTDSGEQTAGGYLPDTTYPTEWTVELW